MLEYPVTFSFIWRIMQWYSIKNVRQSDLGEIVADIRVPPDSPWFSGHFPGEPILPGIAQLGMALDAINQSCGQNLRVSSINRVRFKHIIRPNDCLKVVTAPLKRGEGLYSFRIMIEDKLVCSGIMALKTSAGKIMKKRQPHIGATEKEEVKKDVDRN